MDVLINIYLKIGFSTLAQSIVLAESSKLWLHLSNLPLTPSIMASVALCHESFLSMFSFAPRTPPCEMAKGSRREHILTYRVAFLLLQPLTKHLLQGRAHSRTSVNASGIASTLQPSQTVTIWNFIGECQKNQGSIEAPGWKGDFSTPLLALGLVGHQVFSAPLRNKKI